MDITGTYTFNAPPERVWNLLMDPEALAGCIPGCEQLAPAGEDIAEKFALFSEPWQPKRIGRIDGYDVRIVRMQKGEFVWHSHADADEFFFVVDGVLRMHFRDRFEDVPSGIADHRAEGDGA